MHCLKSFLKELKKTGNFNILANVHTPIIDERTYFSQDFWQTFTLFILNVLMCLTWCFTLPFNKVSKFIDKSAINPMVTINEIVYTIYLCNKLNRT